MLEAKRQAMLDLGNKLKFYAQTENLEEFTIVAFK